MNAHSSEGRLVRAFVAVPLPQEVRERALAVQERLRTGGVKWVEPQNLHITLRFLGYAEPSRLDAVAASLAAILRAERAFRVVLSGVDAFPNRRRPQTIWIGVGEGARELDALAAIVERVARDTGFEAERRPFRAHLTLGRVKAERPPEELVRALEREPLHAEIGTMAAQEVVLMRSDLRRDGPIYTPLATFLLCGE